MMAATALMSHSNGLAGLVGRGCPAVDNGGGIGQEDSGIEEEREGWTSMDVLLPQQNESGRMLLSGRKLDRSRNAIGIEAFQNGIE
jgi:hypothetical protein